MIYPRQSKSFISSWETMEFAPALEATNPARAQAKSKAKLGLFP